MKIAVRRGMLLTCMAIACIVQGTLAHAATIAEETLATGDVVIRIEGGIAAGDELTFRSLAVKYDRAIVALSSDGGSLLPALEIGKAVRLRGFATVVLPDAQCTSACALIWLAGSPRLLSETSRIGFHASYREVDGEHLEIGVGNAMVGRYLTLLNMSERTIIFATSASPNQIQWLDPISDADSGIDFVLVESETTASSEAAGPADVQAMTRDDYEFEWSNDPWTVSSVKSGCVLIAEYFSESSVENMSSIWFMADGQGQSLILVLNEKFRSLEPDQTYRIKVSFRGPEGDSTNLGTYDAHGMDPDEIAGKGFVIGLDTATLLPLLRRHKFVSFYRRDRLIDEYPLDGSAAGVSALLRCIQNLPPE